MHTLVVTNDFPPRFGGIETFVAEVAGRFRPGEVTVLASSRRPFTAARLAHADAALPYEVVRHPAHTLLPTRAVADFAAQVARSVRADSVWFAAAAPLALMAPRLRARAGVGRLVATTHGHEVWWAALPGTRDALRRIGEGVDTVTYLTDYTARRIAPRLSPAARARMARLSPGVDGPGFGRRAAPPAPAEARAAFGLGDGPLVLCVSRLVPRKGQDRLIEGWPSVVAAHPKARLVIAGSGPYEARLRAMVAASRAPAGSIVMTGRVGDRQLPGLYGAASVFAMPCRSGLRGLDVEGLGIVFLEAQAAGVPVVAGRSGGAPDAVLEGETGFVVDGRTPGPAAARIVELLDGPARATAMGAAGRDWVGREWDWQSRYESLARLLRP